MKRARAMGVVIAVAAVAVITTTGLPGSAAAAPTVDGATVSSAQQAEVRAVVEAKPDQFAGAVVDPATGVLTVRVVQGKDGAARTALRSGLAARSAAGPKGSARTLRLQPAAHSMRELTAVRDRVTTEAGWAAKAKPVLSEWYVNVATNTVDVGVTRVTPELTRAAQQRFGSVVRLHQAGRPSVQTRLADSVPWYGGARINMSTGGFCTTGFAVRQIGTATTGMITAGHCGVVGTVATNNGVYLGTFVQRSNGQELDGALMTGSSYNGRVFGGAADPGTPRRVTAELHPFNGEALCLSGSVTGENCAGIIQAQDICVTFTDGITRCHLGRITSSNGSSLSTSGDSGGPAYQLRPDGTVWAYGLIIGGLGSTSYTNGTSRAVPAGWALAFT
jgi:hypothetical protein